jgi:hypothetical protein
VGSSARHSCVQLCTSAQPSCNLCYRKACPERHCKGMHMNHSAKTQQESRALSGACTLELN